MKRNTKLATILTLGTAAAVGAVLAAGPVSAAAGGSGGSSTTAGAYTRMMGAGSGSTNTISGSGGSPMMGSGGSGYSGMMGGGMSGMMGANGVGMMGSIAVTTPSGTVRAAQKAALAGTAGQEQLSRDLYQAFATRYNSTVLDHAAAAAAYQLEALRTLMTRYGVTDPTAGSAPGTFSDPAVQATYNRLLAQGQVSYDNALTAMHALEAAHVTELTNDLAGLTAPDVQQVYTRLLTLSEMYQGMLAQSTD